MDKNNDKHIDKTLEDMIQKLAEEVCEYYLKRKNEVDYDISVEEVIKEEDIIIPYRNLVFSIMRLYKKEKRTIEMYEDNKKRIAVPDSNSWNRIAETVVDTIPGYKKINNNGDVQEYTRYFGVMYKRNGNRIKDLPDDMAIGETEDDRNGKYWGALEGDSYAERQMRTMLNACKKADVEIKSASEVVINRVYEVMKRYAEDRGIKNRYNKSNIREYVEMYLDFGCFSPFDPDIDAENIRNSEVEERYFEDDWSHMIQFLSYAAELIGGIDDKKERRIIRCMYTNLVADYFRDYVNRIPQDGYWKKILKIDKDQDEVEENERVKRVREKCRQNRTKDIADEFRPIEDKLFKSLLHIAYLSYVLEDPRPNRIRYVCLNNYRIIDGREASFSDETIRYYVKTDGKIMSKGSITKTYRNKFEKNNQRLRNYLDSIR